MIESGPATAPGAGAGEGGEGEGGRDGRWCSRPFASVVESERDLHELRELIAEARAIWRWALLALWLLVAGGLGFMLQHAIYMRFYFVDKSASARGHHHSSDSGGSGGNGGGGCSMLSPLLIAAIGGGGLAVGVAAAAPLVAVNTALDGVRAAVAQAKAEDFAALGGALRARLVYGGPLAGLTLAPVCGTASGGICSPLRPAAFLLFTVIAALVLAFSVALCLPSFYFV